MLRTIIRQIIPFSFCLILFIFPVSASANMGIPMLAVAWPVYWVSFIPVVFLEAFIAKKIALLPLKTALKVSLVGNLWSTIVGIPVVWAVLLNIEQIIMLSLPTRVLETREIWHALLFPFMIAWLGSTENIWLICLAFILLAIPFCVASIWLETAMAKKMVPEISTEGHHYWVVRANIVSYMSISIGVMFFCIITYLGTLD